MKALVYADNSGKAREEELSGDLKKRAEEGRTKLCEVVAESDDALLEKYLEQGTLDNGELRAALRNAVAAGKVTPVLCGSGTKNIGIAPLMDAIVELLPPPAERPPVVGRNPAGEPVERKADPSASFAALVFKTVIDPFAGKLSIFRVVSGHASSDATVLNSSRQSKERFGQLLRLEGKKQSPLPSAIAGEIVAVAKLKDTVTGDTLCDEKAPIIFDPPKKPSPVISFAIRPKSKGDEEKATLALHKLVEEDPALETHRDPQTHEIILSGAGQLHIEVTVERLKRKFNVEVELQAPKVPYKETIKGRAESQGKYKRQSGGRGQYGDCWLKVEPLTRSSGFEFADEVVGGSIPRQFIPAVEKGRAQYAARGHPGGLPDRRRPGDGVRRLVTTGWILGNGVQDRRLDGLQGRAREGQADPARADHVARSELSRRMHGRRDRRSEQPPGQGARRRSEGRTPGHPGVGADVGGFAYSPDLRSMTRGRGSSEAQFSHYEEVPAHLAEKIAKEAKDAKEAAKQAHA